MKGHTVVEVSMLRKISKSLLSHTIYQTHITVVMTSTGVVWPAADDVGVTSGEVEMIVVEGTSDAEEVCDDTTPAGLDVGTSDVEEISDEVDPTRLEVGTSEVVGCVSVTGQIVVDTGLLMVVRIVEVACAGQFVMVEAQLMTVETTEVSKIVEVVYTGVDDSVMDAVSDVVETLDVVSPSVLLDDVSTGVLEPLAVVSIAVVETVDVVSTPVLLDDVSIGVVETLDVVSPPALVVGVVSTDVLELAAEETETDVVVASDDAGVVGTLVVVTKGAVVE